MYRYSRLAAVLGCAATLAMVGCSTTGSGVTPTTGGANFHSGWVQKDGIVFHTPHYMATAQKVKTGNKPAITLVYSGGPVLVNPKMYIILWGFKTYGDPNKVAKLLKSYAKNIGGSGYNNIYTQYYMTSGSNVYITNPAKQLGGVLERQLERRAGAPDRLASRGRSGPRRHSLRLRSLRFVRRSHPDRPQLVGALVRPIARITAPLARAATSFPIPTCRTCRMPAVTAAPASSARQATRAVPTKA